MAERDGYVHGVFNWVDLCTGDTDQAKAFYGPLFGVAFTEPTDDNPYIVALKGERLVWGLMPQPEHLAGMPYFWETYIKRRRHRRDGGTGGRVRGDAPGTGRRRRGHRPAGGGGRPDRRGGDLVGAR